MYPEKLLQKVGGTLLMVWIGTQGTAEERENGNGSRNGVEKGSFDSLEPLYVYQSASFKTTLAHQTGIQDYVSNPKNTSPTKNLNL